MAHLTMGQGLPTTLTQCVFVGEGVSGITGFPSVCPSVAAGPQKPWFAAALEQGVRGSLQSQWALQPVPAVALPRPRPCTSPV